MELLNILGQGCRLWRNLSVYPEASSRIAGALAATEIGLAHWRDWRILYGIGLSLPGGGSKQKRAAGPAPDDEIAVTLRAQDRRDAHNLELTGAIRLIAAWRGQAIDFSR
jgi:hypothetical protein